jgi:WD40 repeat protein
MIFRPSKLECKIPTAITSLTYKNHLFVGGEGGEITLIDLKNVPQAGKESILLGFEGQFDYFEEEKIKEEILCIEKMPSSDLFDTLLIANERHLKAISVKNDFKDFKIRNSTVVDSCHRYIINSLSLNCTNEFLISSDMININMWKPSRIENFFTLVNIKPEISKGNIFVINSTKFHPTNENLFAYCTSSGNIHLHDLSICPTSQNIFSFALEPAAPIRSISDFCFINSNTIATRTLDAVTLFDIRSPMHSLHRYTLINNIQDYVDTETLYEKCQIIATNSKIITGIPHGNVVVVDLSTNQLHTVDLPGENCFIPTYITLNGMDVIVSKKKNIYTIPLI